MKKFLKIICIICIALLLFDFIPIKFAKKVEIIYDNYNSEQEIYICEYTQTSMGNMGAYPEYNHSLDTSKVFFEVINSPYNVLSKEFTTEYIEPTGNKFVITGNSFYEEKAVGKVTNINVEKWDIVYPINRKSLRALYVPKEYLTIYDFNWFNVLK